MKNNLRSSKSAIHGLIHTLHNTLRGDQNLCTNLQLKHNNFTFLRFLLAGVVVMEHVHELSGAHAIDALTAHFSGTLAVKGFFVLSGILVFMSYENSKSVGSYFSKRIRRIYPAYFMIVMLCAIGLPALSESFSLKYYCSSAWLKYVVSNLFFLNFLEPSLPGVFEGNKLSAVNGSLWTLKIEMMFYFSVPIIVYLYRRYGRFVVMVGLYVLSAAYLCLMRALAEKTGASIYLFLSHQLPGQLMYFIAGSCMYYYLPWIERRLFFVVGLAIAVCVVNAFYPLILLEPLAVAVFVTVFGLYRYFGNFDKYGDLSYGVYILHFPIIQVLIVYGCFQKNPYQSLMMTIILVILGAFASWNLVEKRFLKSARIRVPVTKGG